MESIKFKSFRTDYKTLAKRLLAINGFHAEASYNPHKVKAFVIHNEYSILCISIGDCLQEALDNAVDNDCLDSCLVEDQDYNNDDLCSLGNAGELFDLSYIGVLAEVSQYKKAKQIMKYDKQHYKNLPTINSFNWVGFDQGYHLFTKQTRKGFINLKLLESDIADLANFELMLNKEVTRV